MDTDILKNQITGFEAQLKQLRADERLFIKDSAVKEQAEEIKVEIDGYKSDADTLKETIKGLKEQKAAALSKTGAALAETMSKVLTRGEAVFDINDEGVFLGWDLEGKIRAFNALSGGELVEFSSALSFALKADVLVIEGAEMDEDRLTEALKKLDQLDIQVIVNSCHPPGYVPDSFKVVEL